MPKKTRTEFIARGLLIRQGAVLMCQNRKHGYCYLPGGHIEFAERAADALGREFLEETGLPSTIGPLLLTTEQCFHDGTEIHHELNAVFHVEQLGHASGNANTKPNPSPTDDQPKVSSLEHEIEFIWLDLAQVPEADIRPVEIKAWLVSGGATDPSHGPWISGFEIDSLSRA